MDRVGRRVLLLKEVDGDPHKWIVTTAHAVDAWPWDPSLPGGGLRTWDGLQPSLQTTSALRPCRSRATPSSSQVREGQAMLS